MTLSEYVIMPGKDYQATCDAVRTKTGKTELLKSGDLATEIRTISGDPVLQEKTVTQNGEVTADEGYDGLSKVSVYVESVWHLAQAQALSTGTFEFSYEADCIRVGFGGCRNIAKFSSGSATSIGCIGAFFNCTNLEAVNMPSLTEVPMYTFSGSKLTAISLPACTTIEEHAFTDCQNMADISLPLATTIGEYAFYSCHSLTEVCLPKCTKASRYILSASHSLRKVDLPECTVIDYVAFQNSKDLETIILRSPTMATLNSASAFYGTQIGNANGYIYVPSALLEEYKAATNWDKYADQFRAIEDYPDITGG